MSLKFKFKLGSKHSTAKKSLVRPPTPAIVATRDNNKSGQDSNVYVSAPLNVTNKGDQTEETKEVGEEEQGVRKHISTTPVIVAQEGGAQEEAIKRDKIEEQESSPPSLKTHLSFLSKRENEHLKSAKPAESSTSFRPKSIDGENDADPNTNPDPRFVSSSITTSRKQRPAHSGFTQSDLLHNEYEEETPMQKYETLQQYNKDVENDSQSLNPFFEYILDYVKLSIKHRKTKRDQILLCFLDGFVVDGKIGRHAELLQALPESFESLHKLQLGGLNHFKSGFCKIYAGGDDVDQFKKALCGVFKIGKELFKEAADTEVDEYADYFVKLVNRLCAAYKDKVNVEKMRHLLCTLRLEIVEDLMFATKKPESEIHKGMFETLVLNPLEKFMKSQSNEDTNFGLIVDNISDVKNNFGSCKYTHYSVLLEAIDTIFTSGKIANKESKLDEQQRKKVDENIENLCNKFNKLLAIYTAWARQTEKFKRLLKKYFFKEDDLHNLDNADIAFSEERLLPLRAKFINQIKVRARREGNASKLATTTLGSMNALVKLLSKPPRSKRMTLKSFRPALEASSNSGQLMENDKIYANFRDAGTWYPGTISKVEENTFSILYDSGMEEISVPHSRISKTLGEVKQKVNQQLPTQSSSQGVSKSLSSTYMTNANIVNSNAPSCVVKIRMKRPLSVPCNKHMTKFPRKNFSFQDQVLQPLASISKGVSLASLLNNIACSTEYHTAKETNLDDVQVSSKSSQTPTERHPSRADTPIDSNSYDLLLERWCIKAMNRVSFQINETFAVDSIVIYHFAKHEKSEVVNNLRKLVEVEAPLPLNHRKMLRNLKSDVSWHITYGHAIHNTERNIFCASSTRASDGIRVNPIAMRRANSFGINTSQFVKYTGSNDSGPASLHDLAERGGHTFIWDEAMGLYYCADYIEIPEQACPKDSAQQSNNRKMLYRLRIFTLSGRLAILERME